MEERLLACQNERDEKVGECRQRALEAETATVKELNGKLNAKVKELNELTVELSKKERELKNVKSSLAR